MWRSRRPGRHTGGVVIWSGIGMTLIPRSGLLRNFWRWSERTHFTLSLGSDAKQTKYAGFSQAVKASSDRQTKRFQEKGRAKPSGWENGSDPSLICRIISVFYVQPDILAKQVCHRIANAIDQPGPLINEKGAISVNRSLPKILWKSVLMRWLGHPAPWTPGQQENIKQ